MDNTFFIKQIDSILNEYNSKIDTRYSQQELESKLITKTTSLTERITGINSEYYKELQHNKLKKGLRLGRKLEHIIRVLKALKDDLENDYLKTYSELIHSNIFSDFIEMSMHLIQKGYKDSAAVIVGSTLEAHLKELCQKNNIPIEIENSKGKIKSKSASQMNVDLKTHNIYNLARQKQIVAWQEIRNKSAHGQYDEYDIDEIKLMIQGVQNFIINFPA